MNESVYVIQMCDPLLYQQQGKQGRKISDMSCHVKSVPSYGTTSKTEAIAECRKRNRKYKICMICYPEKINIYK